MKKHPFLYLIIGIIFLIVPTTIYLYFLIPDLTEAYNILMASGGIIGGAGYYSASMIPEKIKYSSLFKIAVNSFTTLVVVTIVQEFITQLIGLVVVFIFSFIIFLIFKGAYKNGKQKLINKQLSEEITRSIIENIK